MAARNTTPSGSRLVLLMGSIIQTDFDWLGWAGGQIRLLKTEKDRLSAENACNVYSVFVLPVFPPSIFLPLSHHMSQC